MKRNYENVNHMYQKIFKVSWIYDSNNVGFIIIEVKHVQTRYKEISNFKSTATPN